MENEPTNPEPVQICPDVEPRHLRRLAANVILQAIKDTGINPRGARARQKKLDALFFLVGPGFQYWSDLADLNISNPVIILPRLGQIRKKLERKPRK